MCELHISFIPFLAANVYCRQCCLFFSFLSNCINGQSTCNVIKFQCVIFPHDRILSLWFVNQGKRKYRNFGHSESVFPLFCLIIYSPVFWNNCIASEWLNEQLKLYQFILWQKLGSSPNLFSLFKVFSQSLFGGWWLHNSLRHPRNWSFSSRTRTGWAQKATSKEWCLVSWTKSCKSPSSSLKAACGIAA